jgi:N-acetylglutamate synthase-like GNAT family acetyltransferase
MEIRKIKKSDIDWINNLFNERWGGDFIVSGKEKLYCKDLPGFVAVENNKIVGLLTHHIENNECEIVTLDSLKENSGIGTALIESMIKEAKKTGISRLWLMTTNDNINAMRFYQKRGFVFKNINVNAIQKSRNLKQSIPEKGYFDIPIRDEIELEYPLLNNKNK